LDTATKAIIHTKGAPAQSEPSPFAKYESAVYVLQSLAAVSDPSHLELAHQINVVGTAAIQIGKSIDTFIKNGVATLVSCTTLVSGVLTGVSALCSLFGPGSPSAEQLILDELTALRHDLDELRTEVRAGFDKIDARLDVIYSAMMRGFQIIDQDVSLALDRLRVVGWQVALLDSEVMNIDAHIQSYLEDGFDQPLWSKVRKALDWRRVHTISSDRFPFADFVDVLNDLEQAGAVESLKDLSRGTRLTDQELADDALLANRVIEAETQGWDSHIGTLTSIARRYSPQGSFGQRNLANLVRWSVAVDTYCTVACAYPEYFRKRLTLDDVRHLAAIGEDWRVAVRDLNPRTGVDGSIYDALLQNYRGKVAAFRRVMTNQIQTYEDTSVCGYDLWGGATQSIHESPRAVPLSIGTLSPSDEFNFQKAEPTEVSCWKPDRRLDAPSQLGTAGAAAGVIAPAIVLAHQLGLGTLSAAWRDPTWAGRKTRQLKLDEDRISGRGAVTVVVSFAVSGNRSMVWQRQIDSGSDFEFGIQTYHLGPINCRDELIPLPKGAKLKKGAKPKTRRVCDWGRKAEPHGWGNGNLSEDPHKRVLLEEQVEGHWPQMKTHIFDGCSPQQNPVDVVNMATKLVED
jgi:hypothetical protein